MSKETETENNDPTHTVKSCFWDMIQKFEAIDTVLFTTFNFSPSFFEANVLPLVTGFDPYQVRDKRATKRQINENLRSTKVTVICDKTTQPDPKGPYKYGLLSVKLKNGRFHPKIILMHGTLDDNTKGAYVSIGSANLSFSAWGINKEVVAYTQVITDNHKKEITRLLKWVSNKAKLIFDNNEAGTDIYQEEGDIRNILDGLTTAIGKIQFSGDNPQGTPQIYISNPEEKTENQMIQFINGENKPRWQQAYIFSPYWERVEHNLSKLNSIKKSLILTRNYGGEFDIKIDDNWSETVDFYEHKEQEGRFSHAKVYLLEGETESRLVAGSANFTSAALETGEDGSFKNVEAVMIFDHKPKNLAYIKKVLGEDKLSLDEVKKNLAQINGEEEGAPQIPPFDVDVLYDWKVRILKYYIRDIDKNIANLKLMVGDNKIEIDNTLLNNDVICKKELFLPCAIRQFKITCDKNSKPYEHTGLVYQINANDFILDYFPKTSKNDLLETFRSIDFDKDRKKHKKKFADRVKRAYEKAEISQAEEEFDEKSFDYFGLYQAFYKLEKYIHTQPQESNDFEIEADTLEKLYQVIISQNIDEKSPQNILTDYLTLLEIQQIRNLLKTDGQWWSDIDTVIDTIEKKINEIIKHDKDTQRFLNENCIQGPAFLSWCKDELINAN